MTAALRTWQLKRKRNVVMARRKNLWMAVLSAATAVAVVGGSAVAYEEPEYTLIKTVNGVEYRQYRPYLIAETRISGQPDRDKAANAGLGLVLARSRLSATLPASGVPFLPPI